MTGEPEDVAARPGMPAYARPVAALTGALLVALGLLGILGNPLVGSLADVPVVVTGPMHDLSHLVLGALYLHVAFALTGRHQANGLVWLGVFSLAFAVVSLVSGDLFGLLGVPTDLPDQLLHLIIGASSMLVGALVRSGRPVGTFRRGGHEA